MQFTVFIPVFSPGLNQTYKTGRGRFYKSKEAKEWQAKAALIIGSAAAEQEWVDDSKYYEILIEFNHPRQDVDAPIKLIIDTVSQKLGFNDKKIKRQCSEDIKDLSESGVWITLQSYE